MKDRCFLSTPERPHALGAGVGCIMCDGKRREDARQNEGAVAVGLQRPAVARGEVSA
jgi:hypothetical protein